MRLRRDLAGAAEKSPAFRALAEEVNRLLNDDNLTSMMLKGHWGGGKTSAMRSITDDLSNQARPILKRTISFISLAGVNEISDERALFFLGLDEIPEWAKPILGAAKGVAEKGGVISAGVAKTIETLNYIGQTSRMSGALVVLDDIERRGANLPMEDVFGAIIRLVEVRGCKVVLIMNEEQLDEKSQEALARYREKIFDCEYEFKPTPNEAVSAVAKGDFYDLLLQVFEAIGVANLRIIAQANRALRRFSETLRSAHHEGHARILENVCKIAALRLTTESRLEAKDLESGMLVGIRAHRSEQLTPVQQKLETLDFYPSEADQIILSYFETGCLDDKKLEEAARKEAGYGKERKLSNEQAHLSSKLQSGFSSFEASEIDRAKGVLEECVSDCRQWAFPSSLIWTLGVLGVDINRTEYERKWASTCPLPEGGWAGEHAAGFTDHEALAILEKRFRERVPQVGFDWYLEKIAYGSFETNVLASDQWTNAEWLHSKLSQLNSPKLIETLRAIWMRCEKPELQPHLAPFQLALGKALSILEGKDVVSALRVKYIRTGKWHRAANDHATPQLEETN